MHLKGKFTFVFSKAAKGENTEQLKLGSDILRKGKGCVGWYQWFYLWKKKGQHLPLHMGLPWHLLMPALSLLEKL